jgi:large conductance mechanosensitive channel
MPKKEEEEVIPDNTELYLKEIRDALVNKSDSSTFNNEEPNK